MIFLPLHSLWDIYCPFIQRYEYFFQNNGIKIGIKRRENFIRKTVGCTTLQSAAWTMQIGLMTITHYIGLTKDVIKVSMKFIIGSARMHGTRWWWPWSPKESFGRRLECWLFHQSSLQLIQVRYYLKSCFGVLSRTKNRFSHYQGLKPVPVLSRLKSH